MRLSLNFSPCPNDTFIFHALANGLVRVPGVEFDITLADVERLNESAAKHAPDVCKVSVAAAADVLDEYRILRSGGALGRGVGPILVSRGGTRLEALDDQTVAIPGSRTTANLIFGLLCRERGISPQVAEMVYDEVMPAVISGACAAGVVIHEGRFTYAEQGLSRLLDLGAWWEQDRGLPIPLGCIVMRRSHGLDLARAVNQGIRASLLYARQHPEASAGYIREHAQEMDPGVIARHIETFVTDASLDIGPEGEAAGLALMAEARRGAGGLPQDVYLKADAGL
ncbi:MAG: 1,4-dihydroxy-6-naphthoate synthase [Humidesulfovibrio sp.]|uniref:1,4-dihydroxy-6-naphthoate synthase n=1 Tax=Humidesulfovibrio sp. TaxID=2910988 RepID=UPI0027374B85|nr:1,4-dihydroxy-6-naphthoate synthase [Humidesulfovibrio sp.]MDP2847285.1 1,4-dihydroxy-6-naphthoate synthase [Humidesulfovibrio sp.]